MSRDGLTSSQIYLACERLAKNGHSVTVSTVRAEIGGSNSTLAPIVRSWKAARQSSMSEWASDLPPDLMQALKGLYDSTVAQATLRAEEAQAGANERILQYKTSLADAAGREKTLAAEKALLQNQIAELIAKIEAQDAALSTGKDRIKELEAAVDERTQQLAARDEDLLVAQNDFSVLRLRVSDQLRSAREESNEAVDRLSLLLVQGRVDKDRLERRVEELEKENLKLRSRVR